MRKTIYSNEQDILRQALLRVRIQAGLKQADLATRLGKPQSFVSKYESGQRRLDFLEVRQICQAAGVSMGEFVRIFEALAGGR